MTSMDLLKTQLGMGKGHWAVIVPAGCRFTPGYLDIRQADTDVFRLRAGTDGALVDETGAAFGIADLAHAIAARAESVSKTGRRKLRVILTEFECLSLDDQCAALKASRSKQEESPHGIACQVLACGQWNYLRMRGYYRQKESVSPALQTKDVFHVPSPSPADVVERLRGAGLVSASPSRTDEIAAQLIVEATAGDEDLCAHIFERLRVDPRHWHTHLETALIEIGEAPDLHEVMRRRLSHLDQDSAALLFSVLRHQLAETSYDSIDAEELRVQGLVREAGQRAARMTWSVASPLLDRLLRNCGHSLIVDVPSCERGVALSWSRVSVSGEAHRLISVIEDLLRNLVVLEYCAKQPDWTTPIGAMTADARYAGPDLAEANMVRTVVREVLAELGLSGPKQEEAPAAKEVPASGSGDPIGPGGSKRQKTTILQSAIDWQRRQSGSFLLQLSGQALVQFLTFGDLQSILLNKKAGMCEPGGYFDKAQLTTHLVELKAIRDAVAHNQPLSMRTLQSLQGIHDYLIHCVISRAAARALVPPHERS